MLPTDYSPADPRTDRSRVLIDLLPYLLLFALFALPALRHGFVPAGSSRLWFAVVGIVLIVMIGLRYEVGADWWSYVYILRYEALVSWPRAMAKTEPGYALLNIIATRMGWSLWFPNLICASIFTYGLLKFCRGQPNPALALAVSVPYLIVGVAMGFTRQSAALGFIFLAICFFGQGKTVKMLLCLALATAFHTSALIMVLVLGIATVRRGPLVVILLILMGSYLGYAFYETLRVLINRYTTGTFTSGGALPRLLMNVVPAVIFLSYRRRIAANDGEMRLWTIFSGLAFFSAFLLLIVSSSTLVDRLGIYVAPLQVFVLSRLPSAFGTRLRPSMMLTSGILLYSLASEVVWLSWGTWGHAWLPYANYLWQPEHQNGAPKWFLDAVRWMG